MTNAICKKITHMKFYNLNIIPKNAKIASKKSHSKKLKYAQSYELIVNNKVFHNQTNKGLKLNVHTTFNLRPVSMGRSMQYSELINSKPVIK